MAKKCGKNAPNWHATDKDYELLFTLIDGEWREVGGMLPKYANITLADYLSELEIDLPDFIQFMRIVSPTYRLELRAYGAYVRVSYEQH